MMASTRKIFFPIVSNVVCVCRKGVCSLTLGVLGWMSPGSSRVWEVSREQVVAEELGAKSLRYWEARILGGSSTWVGSTSRWQWVGG